MSESHIGTLREKPLHASLKQWCSQPGDTFEQPVDGFVIDVVSDDMLIEVQTRSFSSMERKLTTLLELGHRIRVVHPIAIDKWIVKVDDEGDEIVHRDVRVIPTQLLQRRLGIATHQSGQPT